MRIGLISDTHMPYDAKRLPQNLGRIFQDVDLILHAGDIYQSYVLDELSTIAPVLAARGDDDVGTILTDKRVKEEHILAMEGLVIWLIHTYRYNDWSTYELKGRGFWHRQEPPPDVLVYGHTHQASIAHSGPVLLITPGSATFPDYKQKPGTVGLLTIKAGKATGEIFQL